MATSTPISTISRSYGRESLEGAAPKITTLGGIQGLRQPSKCSAHELAAIVLGTCLIHVPLPNASKKHLQCFA